MATIISRRATVPLPLLALALLLAPSQAFQLGNAAVHGKLAMNDSMGAAPLRGRSDLSTLWGGFDVVDDGSVLLSTGSAANRTAERFSEVHMLGPPHSGTNLMVKMLQLNWPDRVPPDTGALDSIVWKHSLSNATDIKRLFAQHLDPSQITLIIQVRSPISQMMSWREEPYSLTPCVSRSMTDWAQPCFSNTKPLHHDTSPGVDIYVEDAESNHFNSTMDVYNQYLHQYLDLERLGGFKNVIWSPYEDLVIAPELTFQLIADKLGWPLPTKDIQVYGDSADSQASGRNVGRDYALEKQRSRPWLRTGSDELPMLCQGIDKEQIGCFSEGSYSADASYPYPYTRDCALL